MALNLFLWRNVATKLLTMKFSFYDNYDVSIDINYCFPSQVYVDIAFLSLYSIRQFANLHGVPGLSSAFKLVYNVHLEKFDIGDYFQFDDNILYVPRILTPRIMTKRWSPAKSFRANFSFNERNGSKFFFLFLHLWGFRFFNSKINFYAIQSINALIRYFAAKYNGNQYAIDKFRQAVYLLGEVFDNPYFVTPADIVAQGEGVNWILLKAFGDSVQL